MEYSSSTKTVLHLIDTTGPGGAERVFVDVADGMRAHGFHSVVVIRGPGWVQQELLKRDLEPVIAFSKGSFNFKFLAELVSIIKRKKVCLIHSHLLGSNVYAAMAGLITRTPVIATYHGMVDLAPDERFQRLKRGVMRRGITRYVAVSEHLAGSIRSRRLLDMEKTAVIYNGVDIGAYGKAANWRLTDRLEIPRDSVLIGCLGNVRPAKDYLTLVKVAQRVVSEYSQVHFVVAGDRRKDLMEEIDLLMDQLDIRNNVHFVGFLEDTPGFLSQLNIFLLCSLSEGFSIATVEAMASSLPILVTRCGGPEEVIEDNKTGLMAKPADVSDISAALLRLLNDRKMAGLLGSEARCYAESLFTMEAMLGKYELLYRELL